MLLLQRSGPITGDRIAETFGVSPRTVYRDMTALERIGIPVSAVSGPHGGYSLVEGYWNAFARLTTEEANAVIAAANSGPVSDLGVGTSLKRGLEKLAAQRSAAGQASRTPQFDPESVLIDNRGWDSTPSTDLLPKLSALISDRRAVHLQTAGSTPAPWELEVDVDPLGLVLKEATWHLVHRLREVRVLELGAIRAVRPLDRRFVPPENFDLAGFWDSWCGRRRSSRTQYRVELEAAPEMIESISHFLASGNALFLTRPAPPQPERPPSGRVRTRIEAGFGSYEEARARIMALGGAARVVRPTELALGIQDYARQIALRYSGNQ